ncbi:MAG: hypothetical protein VR69_15020 [Peptococcaceae bacterium BRH_c4b]|nr:MAG: hypothetical protein VR69_15020 [Peptococcaceae bacterium BRH_c4b]
MFIFVSILLPLEEQYKEVKKKAKSVESNIVVSKMLDDIRMMIEKGDLCDKKIVDKIIFQIKTLEEKIENSGKCKFM